MPQIATSYQRIRVDLNTARTAGSNTAVLSGPAHIVFVKILFMDGASSDHAATPSQSLRIGAATDAHLDLHTLTAPDSEVVFEGSVTGNIYVTNTSQAGKLLILLVGTA